MAVDGRQTTRANGMSLYELRFFMQQLGCTHAMNLDGGGSTALYVAGEPNLGIINVPIDSNIPGKERNVGNILYVATPDAPKPFSCRDHAAPGGVPGMRMWIKADGDLTKDADNRLTAPYIFDYTGFNQFRMEKRTDNAAIQWLPDRLNGYPVVRFDSAAVLRSVRKVRYSTFFSVNTLNRNGTLLGFDEYPSTQSKLRYFLQSSGGNVYIHDGSSASTGTNYNFIPYQNGFDTQHHIYHSSYGKSYDTFLINGAEQKSTPTNFCTRTHIEAMAQIGARNSYPANPTATTSAYFLRGDVAEVIAYPDTLTASKQNRIESYLAVKYGITMTDPKYKYTMSNGDTWWNGNSTAYTPYSQYITCIARDNSSALHQPKAKGTGNDSLPTAEALLTLIHGNDPSMPAPVDDDLYFVIVGCSNDNLSSTTDIISGTDTYRVMQRHWKLNTSGLQSQPFSLEIAIPEVHRAATESAGVLLKNATGETYFPGTLDVNGSKLQVAGLTAQKGDLMYFVLNKNDASAIHRPAAGNSPTIRYREASKTLYINDPTAATLRCDLYSATGIKIYSVNASGHTLELDLNAFPAGLYIVRAGNDRQTPVQTTKIPTF